MIEPKAELSVDFEIIQSNISYLKSLLQEGAFMAIIKANAYGHSLEDFVKNLDDIVDGYGVVRLEEALAIRKNSVKPILLMQGLYNEEGFQIASKNNLSITIHHPSQLNLAKEFNSKLNLWIKFNTGMNRLGFEVDDSKKLIDFNQEENCLMSHLACADNPTDEMNHNQFALFEKISESFNKTSKSILNSAGIIHFPEYSFDWVRCGIAMYGGVPNEYLKTAMTFRSKVISIRNLRKGERIGYGGRYIASEDKKIAVIYCGYADGYPQTALDGTKILINSHECSILGRVSMDLITADITGASNIKEGDWATLWSPENSINLVSNYNDLISYELMTKITNRVIKST